MPTVKRLTQNLNDVRSMACDHASPKVYKARFGTVAPFKGGIWESHVLLPHDKRQHADLPARDLLVGVESD